MHEQVYRDHGYDLVDIPAGEILQRAGAIEHLVRCAACPEATDDK